MKLGGSRRPFLSITTCAARHQILMLGNSAFMRTAFFCDEEFVKVIELKDSGQLSP
jgi:hypothetical protein